MAAHSQWPTQDPIGDRLVAWLRTVFPVAWSLLIGWLVQLGVPDQWLTWANGLGDQVFALLVTAVVYPLLRVLEPKLPDVLTRVFLGSARTPTYTPDPGATSEA